MDKKPSYELPQKELAYIAQYLNGELEHEQREVFELQLMRDEEFRRKVEEVKALLIGIREGSLAQQLDVFHQPAVIPYYRQWWVAASVAIIVLSGCWWLWFSMPSPERLYQSYFVPDMGLPVEMGGADSVRYTFYDGMISYKEGNYADALAKWTWVADAIGTNDTLQYYRGVANMAVGNMDNAIEHLFTVASERKSAFYEESTWYLALCYLNRGEQPKAVALLKRIPHRTQVPELLKKLE